jgi:hypothetical protein
MNTKQPGARHLDSTHPDSNRPDSRRPSKKKAPAGTQPMTKKEDVESSNDQKIDQDFPGYPHGNAREGIIKHQKTN